MPGPARLQRGIYYHIYNRGVNRENLFVEERNYRYFLQLYAHHIGPVADTFAYCLLRNHFHLLVRIQDLTGLKEPSQCFSNLFNAYTKAINKAYGRTGTLFQRPFGRIPVTSDTYLKWLVVYIHFNPQKHRFVDDFCAWPYSSYHAHLSDQPTRVQRDDVLAWFQGPQGLTMAHQQEPHVRFLTALAPDDFD